MSNIGYLSICCGCMFSGKTSWLMQQYKKYKFINKSVVVVNFDQDKRYHNSLLSTHDKQMIPCLQAHLLKDVMNDLINADVILINEGQFFHDLYDIVIDLVENNQKIIHIAALDGDFQRSVFGDVLKLFPRCDDYMKLHALCGLCKNGNKASFSHRITRESSQVSIGSDNYIPLCRSCYENNKDETTSSSVNLHEKMS